MVSDRLRDSAGRFFGPRVNVESVPRLPTFPARWPLTDARRRAYFVFWKQEGAITDAIVMAPIEEGAAILITTLEKNNLRVPVVRHPVPGRSTILYLCPDCGRPCRYLYRYALAGHCRVSKGRFRWQTCSRLRFASQGSYRGRFARAFSAMLTQHCGCVREPYPRFLWDPRAVSDPRLLRDEFPRLFNAGSRIRPSELGISLLQSSSL